MKNKFFIRAFLISLFAFMLYSASMKHLKNVSLKVIGPKITQVKTKTKEPKISSTEDNKPKINSAVKLVSGSQKSLAKKVSRVMGKSDYQVSVEDLNNSNRYLTAATTSSSQNANAVMHMLILIGLYHAEQNGKLPLRTTIKIQKSDRTKGEKLLQTNMRYGTAYLRQAMIHGDKTAANALLRKIGPSQINSLLQKAGISDTQIIGNYHKLPLAKTTAADLTKISRQLYRGKFLNQQYTQIVLGALRRTKPKLASKFSATTYASSDQNFTTMIVQSAGHSYVVSVWTKANNKLPELGKVINSWFEAQH